MPWGKLPTAGPKSGLRVKPRHGRIPGKPRPPAFRSVVQAHEGHSQWVTVEPATPDLKLDAVALADTNNMELRVFANDAAQDGFAHAVLVARLDNLGKGASGAAVQNLELMLGL